MLSWALAERPARLDPLLAREPADELVSRQIHEPLIARLGEPFDDARRVPGLAIHATASKDATLWRLRLRQGVRFQDGARFNAAAVLANAARWRASPEGRRLLPALLAVDAPRPDLVRFILTAPDPELDRRLASPRLGIVSPRALRRAAGGELELAEATDSGTGPFELRERGADRLLLARHTGWWGSQRGLGPLVDQLQFLAVPSPSERISLLRDGSVQVASGFSPGSLSGLRDDPLLAVVASGGETLAAERSVRGLPEGARPPSLNALWLTTVEAG